MLYFKTLVSWVNESSDNPKRGKLIKEYNERFNKLRLLLITYLSKVKLPWEEEGEVNKYRKEVDRYINGFFNPLMSDTKEEFLPKDRLMFLNFNYTFSIQKLFERCYLPYKYPENHIHGKLNDSESVIFGFGFENDDDYLMLEKVNEKNLFTYCKRPRYTEYDNESELRSFMKKNSFEVYILGHSCGISDKTLLNNRSTCHQGWFFYIKKIYYCRCNIT